MVSGARHDGRGGKERRRAIENERRRKTRKRRRLFFLVCVVLLERLAVRLGGVFRHVPGGSSTSYPLRHAPGNLRAF